MKTIYVILLLVIPNIALAQPLSNRFSLETRSMLERTSLEVKADGHGVRDAKNDLSGFESTLIVETEFSFENNSSLGFNFEYFDANSQKGQTALEPSYFEIGYGLEAPLKFLGSSLTSSLYLQTFASDQIRKDTSQAGSVYLSFETDSVLSTSITLETETQFYKYFTTSDTLDVVEREFKVSVSPVYKATDNLAIKLALGTSFEYTSEGVTDGLRKVKVTPKLKYAFREELEAQLSVAYSPFKSSDNSTFDRDFINKGIYGIQMTYKIL
jgi:hypothetical protein